MRLHKTLISTFICECDVWLSKAWGCEPEIDRGKLFTLPSPCPEKLIWNSEIRTPSVLLCHVECSPTHKAVIPTWPPPPQTLGEEVYVLGDRDAMRSIPSPVWLQVLVVSSQPPHISLVFRMFEDECLAPPRHCTGSPVCIAWRHSLSNSILSWSLSPEQFAPHSVVLRTFL